MQVLGGSLLKSPDVTRGVGGGATYRLNASQGLTRKEERHRCPTLRRQMKPLPRPSSMVSSFPTIPPKVP
jgi:hypothetical protein